MPDQHGNVPEVSHSSSQLTDSRKATNPVTANGLKSSERDVALYDLNKYIAVGCLRTNTPVAVENQSIVPDWAELHFPTLSENTKWILGSEASKLLEANWIRAFCRNAGPDPHHTHHLIRVYVLPEDWGRRFIDRRSKSLKLALRNLLHHIDTSPIAWFADKDQNRHNNVQAFEPWAIPENESLFYIFNKLPSPAPSPEIVKNRYSRDAMYKLINSTIKLTSNHDLPALEGLKTLLYPYQARSACVMLQREVAPQLQLDPRLEVRLSPTGKQYWFGARDGSFLQEPIFYETNRGGILAETMGLGKTIICLAVILATKGHFPQIPEAYQPSAPVRDRVGSLADVAAGVICRKAIPGLPGIAYIKQLEAKHDIDLGRIRRKLEDNRPCYEIPAEIPRMGRNTKIPPPRPLVMCSGTLIVVPRNLLHQWQSEICKHVEKEKLKVLVMDSVSKRASKTQGTHSYDQEMDLKSQLPSTTELMEYDIILFTRNRFEQEIQDGADESGRRLPLGASLPCRCSYIGTTRIRDCYCLATSPLYESPLKRLHWLRIILDEGHNFASGLSNAVLLAKQLQAERRWVVSGTPAKNLMGVEVDLSTLQDDETDPTLLRSMALEQKRAFNLDDDTTKAAKALGSLASNFLMVRPWSDSSAEGKLEWDAYIYRHEHQYRKTYTAFSSCFRRTLETLVVKTRPEDVDRDIVLPPMRHRVVKLKPCWFDKMTANLFIQVLRANAITSERSDVDYLFHKNSAKARYSLLRNLRQSNFTWTGFSLNDVVSTWETSNEYLSKGSLKCSPEDARLLVQSMELVAGLMNSALWKALSRAHEVGIAVKDWPKSSNHSFALAPGDPTVLGITQLLEGQSHVDSRILTEDPSEGLDQIGEIAKQRLDEMEKEETERTTKEKNAKERREQEKEGKNRVSYESAEDRLLKAGIPSSCVGGQPLTSRRALPTSSKASPIKSKAVAMHSEPVDSKKDPAQVNTVPLRVPNKRRRMTILDETAELPISSPLRSTHVIGTTSAKLTYLIDKIMEHQADKKIIVFYDGDNAAFYIAQCLEMLYINHRIYARTLDNTKRSEYVALFNEDPDIRVLLIDVACGALGLNLNAASVVLIVNPINRPGLEAQAIKRAHRIGQTTEVLVETLVLEGTIEEAIFEHAKNMSSNEHLEAKTLEDNDTIVDIIQNAKILPVDEGESGGTAQFALLKEAQRVFGRADRHRFQKYGLKVTDVHNTEKPKRKRPRPEQKKSSNGDMNGSSHALPILQAPSPAVPTRESQTNAHLSSIFGAGIAM